MSRKEEMLIAKLLGLSYNQIAKRYNISRQRAQQILSPNEKTKRLLMQQTNYKCEKCKKIIGAIGHIHHRTTLIHPNEYQNISNLQYLCQRCHRNVHKVKEGCA